MNLSGTIVWNNENLLYQPTLQFTAAVASGVHAIVAKPVLAAITVPKLHEWTSMHAHTRN